MRPVLALQWIGTLAMLALPITNIVTGALLCAWWWLTFDGVSRRELALFVGAGVLFTAMDIAAVANGVFVFDDPDLLGLPAWEPLMYGFYLVHTHRMLGGLPASGPRLPSVLFTAAFAGPFLVPLAWLGHGGLFVVATMVLALGLLRFHDRWDLAYAGYMLALGVTLELVGTTAGQWHYEGAASAVPPWSATMFAGIGLALRRLVLPLFEPEERTDAASGMDGGAGGLRVAARRANAGADRGDGRRRERRGLSRAGGL